MEDITFLNSLNAEEGDKLISLPIYVLFLIAGADNYIDKREIEYAEFVVKIRAKQYSSPIYQFYYLVEEVFQEKFNSLKITLMNENNFRIREKYLLDKIKEVNKILNKIDTKVAKELHESLKSYAKGIAESSGGVFGLGAISEEEKFYMNLDMIEINS